MINGPDEMLVVDGTTLVCIICRNTPFLTYMDKYTAIGAAQIDIEHDKDSGFVWPAYIKIMGDDNKVHCVHLSRFAFADAPL